MTSAISIGQPFSAARLAREASVPTVIDVDHEARGVDDLLAEIDVLIVSESFLAEWRPGRRIGEALRKLAAEYRSAAATRFKVEHQRDIFGPRMVLDKRSSAESSQLFAIREQKDHIVFQRRRGF